MKKMLINATQQEELRVALVDGIQLYDLDIETLSSSQKKSNIYKGRITRIEPSLEAVFVDYGALKHGFLPFKEIAKEYLVGNTMAKENQSIKDMLRIGQQVLVQIDKEERGNKGAALTTYISLAGRFLVLMPNNPRAGGVSRRITGDERQEMRDVIDQLDFPEEMGIIIRTAGMGRNSEELQWDLDFLLRIWQAISDEYQRSEPNRLIYQDSNIVVRALRDYLRSDINKILIDDEKVFNQAKSFMELVMPNNLNKLERYQENTPLFSRYQIEGQIESAYQRNVKLPSGGELVIDYTEALVSIDINSSKSTKGNDIEETAYQTNLEAADEIARQMRLRDLGGLIVIDFIDMSSNKNRRDVEQRLNDATKIDRARIQIGKISRFGLMEVSRQRLRPSMDELSHQTCPRCKGQGSIRSVQSMALSLLRIIEEEAIKEKTQRIIGELPVSIATFLLNEKRSVLSKIEQNNHVEIVILPNSNMHAPEYDIRRIREEDKDSNRDREIVPSYREPLTVRYQHDEIIQPSSETPTEAPAVQGILPDEPAPNAPSVNKEALSHSFSKVIGFFKQDRNRYLDWVQQQESASEPAVEKPTKTRIIRTPVENKKLKAKKEEEVLPEIKEVREVKAEKAEKPVKNEPTRPVETPVQRQPDAYVQVPRELRNSANKDDINPSIQDLTNPPEEINGRMVRKGRPRDVYAIRGQGKADFVASTQSPEEALLEEANLALKQASKKNRKNPPMPAVVEFLKEKPEQSPVSANPQTQENDWLKQRVAQIQLTLEALLAEKLSQVQGVAHWEMAQSSEAPALEAIPAVVSEENNQAPVIETVIEAQSASNESNNNDETNEPTSETPPEAVNEVVVEPSVEVNEEVIIDEPSIEVQPEEPAVVEPAVEASEPSEPTIHEENGVDIDLNEPTASPISERTQKLNALGQQLCLDYFRPDLFSNERGKRLLTSGEVVLVRHRFTDGEGQDLWTANKQLIQEALELAPQLWVSVDLPEPYGESASSLVESIKAYSGLLNHRERILFRIPANDIGIEALEILTAEGIHTEITPIFSARRHQQVMDAYLRGLKRFYEKGSKGQTVRSIASFCVNELDQMIDREIGINYEQFKGRVGIGLAKLVYQNYQMRQTLSNWQELAELGAKFQELMWIGTETLNPDYSSVRYLDHLIAPNTLTAVSPKTYVAFMEKGEVSQVTINRDIDQARTLLQNLGQIDYDFIQLNRDLEFSAELARLKELNQVRNGQ